MDFIGVGAQKSGTSWVYSCLFEHPEVCIPVKEIHFFSRDRYNKGVDWYESQFKGCKNSQKRGEFSTSYLYSELAPERVATHYPEVKIIAVLRHPVRRAYSQYMNAIKAGEIGDDVSFEQYVDLENTCLSQGHYCWQLKRYFNVFKKEQIKVLVYEDIEKNPLQFIQDIYRFIGVDDSFVPYSLDKKVNTARTPKLVGLDKLMHFISENMRKFGLGKFVHLIKTSGVTDWLRVINSKKPTNDSAELYIEKYNHYFVEDVKELSKMINRDLGQEWKIS